MWHEMCVAEAAGLRATRIGCFFDDPMHELLGIKGKEFQSLYHFTVGGPVEDPRISSEPAYGGPEIKDPFSGQLHTQKVQTYRLQSKLPVSSSLSVHGSTWCNRGPSKL